MVWDRYMTFECLVSQTSIGRIVWCPVLSACVAVIVVQVEFSLPHETCLQSPSFLLHRRTRKRILVVQAWVSESFQTSVSFIITTCMREYQRYFKGLEIGMIQVDGNQKSRSNSPIWGKVVENPMSFLQRVLAPSKRWLALGFLNHQHGAEAWFQSQSETSTATTDWVELCWWSLFGTQLAFLFFFFFKGFIGSKYNPYNSCMVYLPVFTIAYQQNQPFVVSSDRWRWRNSPKGADGSGKRLLAYPAGKDCDGKGATFVIQ